MAINNSAGMMQAQATGGSFMSSPYDTAFGGGTAGAHLTEAGFWLVVDILSRPTARQVAGVNGVTVKEAA